MQWIPFKTYTIFQLRVIVNSVMSDCQKARVTFYLSAWLLWHLWNDIFVPSYITKLSSRVFVSLDVDRVQRRQLVIPFDFKVRCNYGCKRYYNDLTLKRLLNVNFLFNMGHCLTRYNPSGKFYWNFCRQ